MLQYALKRAAYSILILFGVLIVTFLLFRLAAGDPAATLLGKNPLPQEIEEMRIALGSDKPLFWGRWCRTECYSSAVFLDSRTQFPGVDYSGSVRGTPQGVLLENPDAEIRFRRNFDPETEKVKLLVRTDSPLLICGQFCRPSGEEGGIILEFTSAPEEIRIRAIPEEGEPKVASVQFWRENEHPFDSQALAALGEVVSFSSTFPYVSFLNFGKTLQTRESIRGKLWRGMWPSLLLMLPIFFGELVIGIALAMLACVKHGRLTDRVILFFSVAGMSISYLALIVFGQWFMGYYLNLFPVWGWGDPRHLALPILIGIVSGTGSGVRFYRTVFLNELGKEYLRTAVAKGCSPFSVYFKHLLKNAMVPVITRASTVLPFLFTGSLLLESFFGIPGLGYEGVNALNDADLQMLKALVLLGAFLFVGINLITDLAYAWIDPRIRPGKKS